MSRELNHELFGEPAPSNPRSPTRRSAEAAPASAGDLKTVGFQVDGLARKLKEFESKLELMSSKWEELAGVSKLRFERIQGHFQRQSEGIQASFRDTHSKIATLASRINERKVNDGAVADLVDRHQQLVENFEVRLQQFQKVVSEQELQLMNSRSELKEAMRELARLKRG